MNKYFSSNIGRLRFLGFLEGLSLILLIFIAVPLKRMYDMPEMVKIVGPIHGALFLLFVAFAFIVAYQYKWKFMSITWKVLLSCLLPFGTYYVDEKILKEIHQTEMAK